mgnify:CR=1 FL=1
MQHCHFKTLSLRQLTLYYIEMRKVLIYNSFCLEDNVFICAIPKIKQAF